MMQDDATSECNHQRQILYAIGPPKIHSDAGPSPVLDSEKILGQAGGNPVLDWPGRWMAGSCCPYWIRGLGIGREPGPYWIRLLRAGLSCDQPRESS